MAISNAKTILRYIIYVFILTIISLFGFFYFVFPSVFTNGILSKSICYQNDYPCVSLNSQDTGGIDYTTTRSLIFKSHNSSQIVFEPETSVKVTWISNTMLGIDYDWGECKLIGKLPENISIKITRTSGKDNNGFDGSECKN